MTGQFDRMTFKDDADFDAYLTSTQPTIDKMAQQAADNSMRRSPGASFANKGEDGVSSGVAAYVKARTDAAQGSALGGKQV